MTTTADPSADLPADVLAAIHEGRKIEAIKRLREHRHIGLKEAKDIVDAYQTEHPNLSAKRTDRAESGLGRLLAIGVLAAVAYGTYYLFFAN
jgi:ribosomal protein L7/L12